ncbi:Long-chain-fatty-acid-CoA ligase [Mycena kentingensis (nom. inval.)]|nr:Long-chain-fatty-acid-CoA ligase [Mycena kentingensis (nom. inval.)]
MSSEPKRTLAETNAILCAPGAMHELDTIMVDGRLQRVYKNQWPSVRDFWLWASDLYADKTYIVFENRRYTYKDTHLQATKLAAMFAGLYGVEKGDRVGICSRNLPEYLMIFWACHLIGAIPTLANAFLPSAPLVHCLTHTQCKVIVLDSERADRLESVVAKLHAAILVIEDGKGRWKGNMLIRS